MSFREACELTGRALSVGVDEAGYAPKLGPLVVTATGLERPAEGSDLYATLAPAVASSRDSALPGGALFVADSKQVYRPGGGLAGLERGVLAFLAAARKVGTDRCPDAPARSPAQAPVTDLDLVRAVSGAPPDLDGLAWYGGAPSPLPVEADARDVDVAAEALSRALERSRCGRPMIRSRVVTARELNGAICRGLNKAQFLVEVVAELVAVASAVATSARAASNGGAGPIPTTVVVDRLGGRKDYSGLLARAFPAAEVREKSLSQTESCYRVGSNCEVTFACRAESRCMTVALSSMVSKYVRELMMRRLNRYFAERLTGLRPTAGYPQDAARFLEDTRDLRRREGIRDDLFIRAR